jgi:hypothetical protein
MVNLTKSQLLGMDTAAVQNPEKITRQLFCMDSRSLGDLHTLAGRLGISYSLAVREALHLAAERLRQVDRPGEPEAIAAQLEDEQNV